MSFEFERELNHWGKGLTGIDLSNSLAHDEIIMIRTIEFHKDEIMKEPELLFPSSFTTKQKVHIYEHFCPTKCTEERNEKGEIIDLPNVSTTLIGEAVNLAFLHS